MGALATPMRILPLRVRPPRNVLVHPVTMHADMVQA